MKHARIVVTLYGGPDALQVVEEEAPEPRPGEVRLRVLAAGVSLPDVLAREACIPRPPGPPSRRGGTWLVTSIGSETVSRESNQAKQ
jgi:NADPH:quinone reductase